MHSTDGLYRAYVFGDSGHGTEAGWPEVGKWQPAAGLLWVDLDRRSPEAKVWLEAQPGLDPITCEALLAEETRPRSVIGEDTMLVILRGVNLNPGADPEDMVSLRIWSDGQRVITARRQRLLALEDIREKFAAGTGPRTAAEFLATITGRLVERMGPVVDAIQDELDGMEEDLVEGKTKEIRAGLTAVRREAVALRRYLAPQRDVLARLSLETAQWVDANQKARLREAADRTTRYVEELDTARERAALTQEELIARTQDRMNSNMYVLSIVAAVFLPLGFLTGLLGINVGGIPGAESNVGFMVVCAIMLGVVVFQLGFMFVKKWF